MHEPRGESTDRSVHEIRQGTQITSAPAPNSESHVILAPSPLYWAHIPKSRVAVIGSTRGQTIYYFALHDSLCPFEGAAGYPMTVGTVSVRYSNR